MSYDSPPTFPPPLGESLCCSVLDQFPCGKKHAVRERGAQTRPSWRLSSLDPRWNSNLVCWYLWVRNDGPKLFITIIFMTASVRRFWDYTSSSTCEYARFHEWPHCLGGPAYRPCWAGSMLESTCLGLVRDAWRLVATLSIRNSQHKVSGKEEDCRQEQAIKFASERFT